jgi:O-antigen ligase
VSRVQQKPTQRAVAAAFPVLLISLFLIYSAILEVGPGASFLRPQLVLGVIGLCVLFATGQALRVVMTPVGKSLMLFAGWFMLCIPLAIWRGGSFNVFITVWYKSLLMFVLTAGLLTSVSQSKKLFHAIGYAVGLLAILAILKHTYDLGRLMLPNTRYANSNDLGLTLLVGLTFLGYSFTTGTRRERTIAGVLSLPVLLALAKTGSRAAMLGVGMLCVYGFLQASKKNRVRIAIGAPLIILALAVVLPSSLRDRYLTLFKSGAPSSQQSQMTEEQNKEYIAATGSAEARLILLKDSIIITLHHPLFGVGPGNFVVEQNNLALARGEIGMWHLPHNTYTQISSEMGIPGLILYIAFLYQIFKGLSSIIRSREHGSTWADLRGMATMLRAAFVVLATVAFFDSFPYNADVPIMAGLAAALGVIAKNLRTAEKLTKTKVASPAPLPEPQPEAAWTFQY